MKTAISISDKVFHDADTLAARLEMSRSALYTAAIRDYLTRHADSEVTSRLDALYVAPGHKPEPYLQESPRVSRADVW